ncbi:MAG: LON peptidase substrate-binding domain-containing protein [Roseimicrobium sp.]
MDCSDDDGCDALPAEMPVMVLTDCILFPGCLLPLYIYEERYREMLAHALDSHRMFCIGNRDGDVDAGLISPHSTAGLVRACVQQADGTSHLLLLGVQRIRLVRWLQMKPFRIAAIEPVSTVAGDRETLLRLRAELIKLFRLSGPEGAELRKVLEASDDAEMICDVVSYHFTRCPKLQQTLLAEPSLIRRYEIVIEALRKLPCK